MRKIKLLEGSDPDHPYSGALGEAEYISIGTWTAEEALKAQEEWIALNPEKPHGPFWWWSAMMDLKEQRKRYEAGDDASLLDAIRICAIHGLQLPAWCAQEYLNKYRKVIHFKARSWDEAFGAAHPKNINLAAHEKKRRLSIAVWLEIRGIRDANPQKAIDAELFEKVGKKFHIGKTLTEEYYYAAKALFEPSKPR